MIEDLLPIAAIGFLVAVLVMFAFGLKRGSRMQATNAQIEANKRRTIDLAERQIVLAERNAAAMERIATALERRGGD